MPQLLTPGSFISAEGQGTISRDAAVVLALNDGLTTYGVGRVMGRITKPTIVGAVGGTNVGNATLSAVGGSTSPTPGVPLAGVYTATCTAATTFNVTDPTGAIVGTGVFGTAFDNGVIKFLITAGGTACVAGDRFTFTVPATSGKWVTLAPLATDGSGTAAGILVYAANVSTAVDAQVAVVTRYCEVKSLQLDWGTLNAGQITAALAQLASNGIISRVTF